MSETVSPKFAIIGDCYTADEELAGEPFLGGSGRLLTSILTAVGIDRSECLLTNVFNLRPEGNKLKNILVTRKDGISGWPALNKKYITEDLAREVLRCRKEVLDFKPDMIICLGGVALWALTGKSNLSAHRGHYHEWEGIKMLPTYHPLRVLRSYHLKVSLAADIEKAQKLASGETKLAELNFNPQPNLQQVKEFLGRAKQNGIVSVDIETIPKFRAITCIGFGLVDEAICVPFFDPTKLQCNYWATKEEEIQILRLIQEFLADESVSTIWHHGAVYDIPWISDVWGLKVCGPVHDTRIMHSCLLAELPHTLSDVAANYLVFPPWKAMHTSNKDSDASSDTEE